MAETTWGRPHTARLRYDLETIRTELVQTVHEIGPEGFEWSPRPGIKSCKQQLQEIGTMESLTRRLASHGELLDWGAVWNSLELIDAPTLLDALTAIRAETLEYLDGCSEEKIETPIALPEEWQGYFGGMTEIEPEELIRWVIRHEYYHVGQLNLYQMQREKE